MMEIDGLQLPELLTSMIATGRWPSEIDALNKQNLHSLIPPDRNRKLRPLDDMSGPSFVRVQFTRCSDGWLKRR